MPIFSKPGNIITGGVIQATDVGNLYDDINGLLDYQNIAAAGLRGSNFAASTVAVGNIKTAAVTSGVQQATAKHFGGIYIILPSGAYSFYPGLSTDADVNTIGSFGGDVTVDGAATFDVAKAKGVAYTVSNTGIQSYLWLSVLNASNVATNQSYVTANYIQASPPYDMGDGEIPLFIFAAVDSTGQPRATWIAPDPPWALSPKKRLILPHKVRDAAKDPAKMAELVAAVSGHAARKANIGSLKATVDSATTPEHAKAAEAQLATLADGMEMPPPTVQVKNANMAKTPHPFMMNDLAAMGLTVVMLDPHNATAQFMATLHEYGENVNQLLHTRAIKIDNVAMKKASPPGVMVVNHKVK